MTEELMARIYKGIQEYTVRHSCTIKELAADFVRKTAFSTSNNSFNIRERLGFHVIEEGIDGPEIHYFTTQEEAMEKVQQLYPDIEDKALKYICYEAPNSYTPTAGKHEKSSTDLSGMSDSAAVDMIVDAGSSRIADTISDINTIIDGEEASGYLNTVNHLTMEAAINHRKKLQRKLEIARAENVFARLKEDKFLQDEKSWYEENNIPFPSIKLEIDVSKAKSIQYDRLLALDRFLSNESGVTVAHVLVTAHAILAPNFDESVKREALSGKNSNTFGRHLGSDLYEMVNDMASKGFDIQLIFDRVNGQCIGMVKLSDVAGLMSDSSYLLRPGATVSELKDQKLILPPPPQIDASSDLSIAGGILKHGIDAIIVKFDPDNFEQNAELDTIKETLMPGYHIMTSHDIIAYCLNQ
tara:strand:- start:4673 stop:5908 length:1236 start_codon:yes stop_codon:yes gene_type:complete